MWKNTPAERRKIILRYKFYALQAYVLNWYDISFLRQLGDCEEYPIMQGFFVNDSKGWLKQLWMSINNLAYIQQYKCSLQISDVF